MTIDPASLLWFLLDVSLRACAAALAAAVLLRVLDIRAAAVRHAVWTTVLIAMVLMPILPSIVPALPIPGLPSLAPIADRSDALEAEAAPPPQPAQAAGETPTTVHAAAADEDSLNTPRVEQPSHVRVRPWWPVAFLIAYAVGVLVFLGRLARGWRLVAGLVRRARSGGAIRLRGGPTGESGGVALLYQSEEVAVPLSAGAIRPVVVLPTRWREWPQPVLTAVVAHEMAHVQRRDALIEKCTA